MRPILILIHVAVCIALILIVLLQKGKGAGMGAAFGGSSETVFGSSGASTFMHRVTTIAAVAFMLTSLSLSFFFGNRPTSSSIMEGVQTEAPLTTQGTEAPATNAGEAPAQTGEPRDEQK